MATCRFKQVDVFTVERFLGNPVAVVLAADGIGPDRMQRIAAWAKLSETTFVERPTSPEADYRLRIFTPDRELPFAGHPTVGSAHAVLEGGLVAAATTSLRQECGAGTLALTVEGAGADRRIFVRAPEAKVVRGHEQTVDALTAALGTNVATSPAPTAIDVGPIWLVVYVEDARAVARLRPDMVAIDRLSREANVIGLTVFGLDAGRDAPVHLRTFAPAAGVPEDPVCGSCNVALAAYLVETGLLARTGDEYVASQGQEMGRDGRVYVRVGDGGRRIEIGGHAVTTIDGEISV